MQINDESFNSLEKYGKDQNPQQKIYLKLITSDDQLVLKAYAKKDMSLKDKVMSSLHLGEFNLKKIVNFIRSEPFARALENKSLTISSHQALGNAFSALRAQITKHKDKVAFTESISQIKIKPTDFSNLPAAEHVHIVATRVITPSLASDAFNALYNRIDSVTNPLTSEELLQLVELAQVRLIEEVKSGIIVIDPKTHSIVLPSSSHWYAKIIPLLNPSQNTEIQNKANIHHELRLAKTTPGNINSHIKLFAEQVIAKKNLKPPSIEAISKAKTAALEQILEAISKDKKLSTIDTKLLRKEIDWKLYEHVLIAYGFSKEEIPSLQDTFSSIDSAIDKAFKTLHTYLQKVINQPNIQNLPPLVREMFTQAIKSQLTHKMDRSIEKAVNRLVQETSFSAIRSPFIHLLLKTSMLVGFTEIQNEFIAPKLAILTKWQKNLTFEMSQGSTDADEILGKGVCYALSLRWLQNAIQGIKITPEIHAIGPKDRYYQASMMIDPNTYMTGSVDVEKRFKLESPLRFLSKVLKGKKEVHKHLKTAVDDPRFQHPYNGTMQILFGWTTQENETHGHAITVIMQENTSNPKRSTFSISDPNFGTFEFPVTANDTSSMKQAQEKCLDALSDLLTVLYSDKLDYMSLNCFRVKS